ncbi:hypothetical protein M1446_04285 [Candidatus Dependentiae bacterium]|nr:hypothetical protein [Candidatus Dependentiae bacterium]
MIKKFLIFIFFLANSIFSAGNLDTSFNNTGFNITQEGIESEAMALVIQPDGKILAAGSAIMPNNTTIGIISRYKIDGSLDLAFGNNGKILVRVPQYQNCGITDIKIDSNSKIVASCIAFNTHDSPHAFAARFLPSGSLDSTFNNQGFSGLNEISAAHSLDIQTDGKILLAGEIYQDNTKRIAIFRFNNDGSYIDNLNIFPTAQQFANLESICKKIIVQPNNKILIVGNIGQTHFMLTRLTPAGLMDNLFNSGATSINSGLNATRPATSMVLQPDGKIIVGGRYGNSLTLWRFNSDGTIDTSFSGGVNGGLIQVSSQTKKVVDLKLQTDGKIIAIGNVYPGPTKFQLIRLSTSGIKDYSFGTNGIVTVTIGTACRANALAIQNDGKIVICGQSNLLGQNHLMIARFNAQSAPQPMIISETEYAGEVGSGVLGKRPTEEEKEETGIKKIKKE